MATYKDATKAEDAVVRAERSAENADRAGAWVEARRLYEKALGLQEELFDTLDAALDRTNKDEKFYEEEARRCLFMQRDVIMLKHDVREKM